MMHAQLIQITADLAEVVSHELQATFCSLASDSQSNFMIIQLCIGPIFNCNQKNQ